MNDFIYLNDAATSYPKPLNIISSIEKFLEKPIIDSHRTNIKHDLEHFDIVNRCRKEISILFNVSNYNNVIFTSGATESLNLVLFGLPLEGKHIITTAVEHNSVLRPLKTLERDGKITLSTVECNKFGEISPNTILEAIKPNTIAVVINHCSNVTGVINDIEKIGSITKDNNLIFIVDASQSAGLYSIDVQKFNIDFLIFTGHKSLFGIPGIGGVCINKNYKPKPLKIGGTGIHSDYLFQPEDIPLYYEAGTLNIVGILSIYEGIKYIKEIGMDKIRKKKEQTVDQIVDFMSKNNKISLYPSKSYHSKTTLFSFTIKGLDVEDIGYILENNFKIIVRTGLHCAPLIHEYIGTYPSGTVRVSPSYFTSENEIEKFEQAINSILNMLS